MQTGDQILIMFSKVTLQPISCLSFAMAASVEEWSSFTEMKRIKSYSLLGRNVNSEKNWQRQFLVRGGLSVSSLIPGAGAIHECNWAKHDLCCRHVIVCSLLKLDWSSDFTLTSQEKILGWVKKNDYTLKPPGILRYSGNKHSVIRENKIRQRKEIKYLLHPWFLWNWVFKISFLTAILRRGGGGGGKVVTMSHGYQCPSN